MKLDEHCHAMHYSWRLLPCDIKLHDFIVTQLNSVLTIVALNNGCSLLSECLMNNYEHHVTQYSEKQTRPIRGTLSPYLN